MKKFLILTFILGGLTSCGSLLDGLASMYGGGYGGSNYNPYENFWNNASTNATSVPAALNPNTAVDAAYKSTMNSMTSGFWENAAKDEQQKKQKIDAVAKDVWEHPENYQNVPVQSGGVGSSAGSGTVSSSSRSSGSRSNTSSSRQHDLCNGTGKCNSCNGTGSIWKGYGMSGKTKCPNCHGSGRCSGCNGTGRR